MITIKWSKKARDPNARSYDLRQTQALASAYGAHVRFRVQTQARPIGENGDRLRFKYSTRELKKPYFVNSIYAAAVGVDGARFRSSAEFHRQASAQAGAFSVSGDMWKGLTVIDQGGLRSKIYFGGSSLGMRSQKRIQTTKTGKPLKPRKIRNRMKARSIGNRGVHLLQWTRRELEALLLAMAEQQRLTAISRLGMEAGKWQGALIDRRLYREARSAIARGA